MSTEDTPGNEEEYCRQNANLWQIFDMLPRLEDAEFLKRFPSPNNIITEHIRAIAGMVDLEIKDLTITRSLRKYIPNSFMLMAGQGILRGEEPFLLLTRFFFLGERGSTGVMDPKNRIGFERRGYKQFMIDLMVSENIMAVREDAAERQDVESLISLHEYFRTVGRKETQIWRKEFKEIYAEDLLSGDL